MLHAPDTQLAASLDKDGGVRIEIEDFPLPVYWAPRAFVESFRQAAGVQELDICWDPGEDLLPTAWISDHGAPGLWHPKRPWGDRGCWKVLGLINVDRSMTLGSGTVLTYSGKKFHNVHTLNGIHNLPTHMGMWLAGAMADSDLVRRWDLLREKREAHRKAFMQEFQRQDSWSDTYGNDSYVRGLQSRLADHKSPEERKLEESLVRARKESRARDRQRTMKEMGL